MEQEFREILSFNIKVARIKRKLTQDALAELVDVSEKHITKIERANVTPSSYLVYKIAKVLNVSIDKLVAKTEI